MTIDQARRIWNASSGFDELMYNITGCDDKERIRTAVLEDYDKPEFAKRLFDFTVVSLMRARLAEKGSALVTNANREILSLDTASMLDSPIDACFDHVQTIDDWPHRKPDPRVFDRVLGLLGVSSTDTVYIGDEIKDYEAARSAGMLFIGVETGMSTREEFKERGAFSVSTLPDALDVLKLG